MTKANDESKVKTRNLNFVIEIEWRRKSAMKTPPSDDKTDNLTLYLPRISIHYGYKYVHYVDISML